MAGIVTYVNVYEALEVAHVVLFFLSLILMFVALNVPGAELLGWIGMVSSVFLSILFLFRFLLPRS